MAEPETEATEISLRAAEVAADITEADRPEEQRRLVRAFNKAVSSSARLLAAGREWCGGARARAPAGWSAR